MNNRRADGRTNDPRAPGATNDPRAHGATNDPRAHGATNDPRADGRTNDPRADGRTNDPRAHGATNHQRAMAALPAYADGQLGRLRRFVLRRHIDRCAACLRELEALQSLRTAIRANIPVHRAPPGLASRIGSALPREPAPPAPVRRVPALAFGGTALAGALAGVALTLLVARQPDPLIADAVADHVRSLMADHLTDVPSSDQHTVKPWLAARLDLSPVVKDLATEGYKLVGGRLDYLSGHRAAALVYMRARHVINLFAFVAGGPDASAPALRTRDGFNTVSWRMGGLSYVAVSDVEAAQLLEFARLVASD